MRTKTISVRWLGVRGFGKQQQEQKRSTEAKILAFLTVRPQTSEELWKNTHTHKNTLFLRLESLISRNLIIKHRYTLPYDRRNYGGMYHFNFKPLAKINRFYYLVNWSNAEAKDLVNSHFRSEKDMEEDDLETKLEGDVMVTLIKSAQELSKYERALGPNWINKIYDSEKRKLWIDTTRNDIICHRKRQKLDFILIEYYTKFTRRFSSPTSIEDIRTVIKYLSKSSPSIYDVIIRVMTDPIVMFMEESLPQDALGYLYKDVWEILEADEMILASLVRRT